jgi:hypothetical protein
VRSVARCNGNALVAYEQKLLQLVLQAEAMRNEQSC